MRREQPTPAAPAGHLVGLEALRLCCALAILFWHYSHFGYVGPHQVQVVTEEQPFYRELRWVYASGALSVQMFWCISGFVFAWRYGQVIRDGSMSGGQFFWLRFSRLYPLHLATLLLVAVLQYLYFSIHSAHFVYPLNGWREFVLQVFLASNWFQSASASDYSFNGPVWSVSIEVLVYGLFFVIAHWWGVSARVAAVLTLTAGAIFVTGVGRNAVVLCIHYYFLGVLTAWVYARLQSVSRPARVRAAVWGVGLLVVVLTATIPLKATWALSLLAPLLMLGVIDACSNLQGHPRRWINAGGELTYSIYMTHFPLQLCIMLVLTYAGIAVPWRDWEFLALFLIGSIGLGALSFVFLEKPARRALRARYRPSAMPASGAPAAAP